MNKSNAKVIGLGIMLAISSAIAPAQAMEVQEAVTKIMAGIDKHGDQIKAASLSLYTAAKEDRLTSYCQDNSEQCIQVATMLASMTLMRK